MHRYKQFALTGALLLLATVLETKAAMMPLSTIEGFSGIQHAALSASCALLAFMFSALAGGMKDDERPFVRRRARLARIISLALLCVPIGYLGSSFKLDRIHTERSAYLASDAYRQDLALAQDNMADLYERREARARVAPPVVGLTILDGEFWLALFFQVTVITAAGIRISPPATADEIKHWRSVAAARKGVITRKRNAAKRKQRKPLLRIVS